METPYNRAPAEHNVDTTARFVNYSTNFETDFSVGIFKLDICEIIHYKNVNYFTTERLLLEIMLSSANE